MEPIESLILSIIGLLIGPLIIVFFPTKSSWKKAIDGFVLVTIGGLCLLELIPLAIKDSGWISLLPLLIGFVGPWYIEDRLKTGNQAILIAAVFLLGVHCMIDGMVLTSHEGHSHQHNPEELSIGILIHRLPVGMFTFVAIKSTLNLSKAIGSMGFLSAATLIGYLYGPHMEHAAPTYLWPMIQACVAGGLCHVLLHQHDKNQASWSNSNRWFGSIGVLVGAAVLYENGGASLTALLIAGPLMTLTISKWPRLNEARTYISFSFGAAAIGFGLDEVIHSNGVHDHIPMIFCIPVMIGIGLMFTRLATVERKSQI